MESISRKLEELQAGQEEIVRRLDAMNGTMSDVLVEIGGAPSGRFREPDRKSIRRRIHDLENDATAAQVAGAALEMARQKQFTKAEKLTAACVGLWVAIAPVIVPLLIHH